MAKQVWSVLFVAALIGIFLFNHFIYDLQPSPQLELKSLTDVQKESLSLLRETTQLLFSLATAAFGAIGVMTLHITRTASSSPSSVRANAIAAFVFAALSVDFGYVYIEKWAELLANGVFAPFEPLVTIPQTLQLVSFLLALFFLARLALQQLSVQSMRDAAR